MSYEYARVYSLDGTTEFVDYYGEHSKIDGAYTPSIGDWGFMTYAGAVIADGAGAVAMAVRHTPLAIQEAIEAALEPEVL